MPDLASILGEHAATTAQWDQCRYALCDKPSDLIVTYTNLVNFMSGGLCADHLIELIQTKHPRIKFQARENCLSFIVEKLEAAGLDTRVTLSLYQGA